MVFRLVGGLLVLDLAGLIGELPSFNSSAFGLFHRLALNLTRRSSKETAWRKVRTIVFDVVKGNLLGIIPTESTVSLLVKGHTF